MSKKKSFGTLVMLGILCTSLLSGCGAGTSGDVPAPVPGTTVAASIDLFVSNTQLNSDGASTVTLTAIVKDSGNRALEGKEVSFAADSGLLTVTSGTTDPNGTATATLGTGGDPTNRLIHLTASTGSISAAKTVTVTKTAMPTGLTVTAASSTQINLSWTAAAGAVGYKLYKDGAYLKSVTTTSASDGGLTASTSYCYGVSAYDSANSESAQTGQLCATTYGLPPATPAALTVRATLPTQVDLSWTASVGALQYKIYRNGAVLTATTTTSFSDTTAVANTQYAYVVAAIDATGSESAQTGQSIAHTGLTVPSGVTVTVNSSTLITISWTNSGGALVSGYKVYRGGVLMGAVAPKTTTSIVDGSLTANTQYCYSISATSDPGDESAKSGTICGTTQPPPVPASIDLLVSNAQLNSVVSPPETVTLTAIVKDSGNRTMEGQEVSFTADSGTLTFTSETTGGDGSVTATLGTGGDPTNRVIRLTATSGSISATNTVTVTGTTLSISGSASLSFGASVPLTIFLKDSAGTAIANKNIAVTSAKGNTLSAGPYVTNDSGQVIVTVMAAAGGADKITASAIGATKEFDLTVNAAILAFVNPPPPPAAVTEIPIGTSQPVTVLYTIGGVAQAGVTVNFDRTRGDLSSATAVTDADGKATVTVASANYGPGLLVASITGGPSSQIAVEFVATTVSKLELQASPATIGTNSGGLTTEKSLLTAVVRDANNNLVKNKTVSFTIVNDASAGSLSPASAVTDSFGTANAYFIAGASLSGLGGVTIRASVAGTSVASTTSLTVAKKALFITLNTGPIIKALEAPDGTRYQKDYVALVTDAAGNPVGGATVVATVTPMYYMKGYMNFPTGASRWQPVGTLQAVSSTRPDIPACANEDIYTRNPLYDFNGVLDYGEDQNVNNRLDPGNVASVTATVTDSTGHGTLSVVYAKDYAYWVNVKLEAFASTSGSTASAFVTFDLPGLASDYANPNANPPGNPSPFGTSTTCFVDLTATPLSSTQMTITWQKASTAASYNVYRGGMFIRNVTTNTMTDTGLTVGTQYCYQIKTVSSAGAETSFTDTVCASTNAAVPAAPTILPAAVVSPSSIQLSWITNLTQDDGYNVYSVDTSAVPYTYTWLRSVLASPTVFTNLAATTRYCYAVTSYTASGSESSKSAPVCATTQSAPPAPTILSAVGAVLDVGPPVTYKVTLTWTLSTGAVGYKIYRDGTLVRQAPTSPATDATVAGNTGYCYAISALNESGYESAQSPLFCTATP